MRGRVGIDLICALGGDLAEGGASLGPRTIEHCKKAAELMRELEHEGRASLVVLSAGHARRDAGISRYPAQQRSIAWLMHDYLVAKLGVESDSIYVAPVTVWGTRAELREFKRAERVQRKHGALVRGRHVTVSWWHAPRARMHLKPIFGQEPVTLYRTRAPLRAEILWELINVPGEWLRIRSPWFEKLLKKWRGRD